MLQAKTPHTVAALPSHKPKKKGRNTTWPQLYQIPTPNSPSRRNTCKFHPNCPSLNVSKPVAVKHQNLFFSALAASTKPGDYKRSWWVLQKPTLSLGTTGGSTQPAQRKEMENANSREAKVMADENCLPLAEWILTKTTFKSHWVIILFYFIFASRDTWVFKVIIHYPQVFSWYTYFTMAMLRQRMMSP